MDTGCTLKNLEEEVNVILDDEFEETSRPKLDALKQKLTAQLTKIETLDNEIINLVKDTDVETEVSETQIYLDKYSDLILKIESVLKPQPQNNGNKSESQATTLNKSQSSSNKEAKVRLPKIELPHFEGNPLNFQSFWDLFESTVDKNEHLSDVDKFFIFEKLVKQQCSSNHIWFDTEAFRSVYHIWFDTDQWKL